MEIIKSISYSQIEIINNILNLHVPNHIIDCDPTYSTGNFYKDTGISQPKYKYDILPQVEGVEYGDSRNLPLPDKSITCIMFDPPFLATKGKSLKCNDDNNIINKRFGVYPNEKSLHKFYVESMNEAHRVLKENGILIFKCQDKVSSGNQYMSHVFIANKAVEIGFYPKDLFILLSKNRLVADWQTKNQKTQGSFIVIFGYFRKQIRK